MDNGNVQEKSVQEQVQQFGRLDNGQLFICVSEMTRANPPATIYRKIIPTKKGLNIQAENWEGESCNGGRFHIEDNVEVILLM